MEGIGKEGMFEGVWIPQPIRPHIRRCRQFAQSAYSQHHCSSVRHLVIGDRQRGTEIKEEREREKEREREARELEPCD